MKRTSILHLIRSAQVEETGPARIVAALAARLDRTKYDVHAWFFGQSGPLVEDLEAAGAKARSIDWSPGMQDPLGAYRFWRCLRAHDFAIVHHHFSARSVRHLVRLGSHARIIVHLHARLPQCEVALPIPISVRNADAIIAASRAVALPIAHVSPKVVYAGVELGQEIRAGGTVSSNAVVIGTACRLVSIKGVSQLIQAVALLSPEFPGVRLEIAGAGPDREELETEVARLNLIGVVRFLGWQRDLRPILRRWDIFAMPSLEDAFPVAALEAMAEGLPLVATSVGGLPEMVEDGQTGYLVPPSDVAALSEHLRLLLRDGEQRRTMGAAARERAFNDFSVERMVEHIAAIYDSLLPRS